MGPLIMNSPNSENICLIHMYQLTLYYTQFLSIKKPPSNDYHCSTYHSGGVGVSSKSQQFPHQLNTPMFSSRHKGHVSILWALQWNFRYRYPPRYRRSLDKDACLNPMLILLFDRDDLSIGTKSLAPLLGDSTVYRRSNPPCWECWDQLLC